MIKVLFVCLGNICRSPLAEGLFIKKLEDRGLDTVFEVDSCGTGAYHIGERPDPRTLENAQVNGVHLPSRARQVRVEDFTSFDYILAMDHNNRKDLISLDSLAESKVRLMREFDHESPGSSVPDPYFGGPGGFQDVFEILDRSTEAFLDWLQTEDERLRQAE
jgi:protein-tyrosine phosphatase